MKIVNSLLALVGRVFLAAVFIWAAAGKIMFYEMNAQYMASKGLTLIPPLLFGAALVELLGGLSLILGYKTRYGAALLLLFLIPTTIIFHDFWNETGAERIADQINFMKNIAIFGGLLFVLVHGAGRFSVDNRLYNQYPPEL